MPFANRGEEERLPAGNFLGPFFSVRFFSSIGELKNDVRRGRVGSEGILARTGPDGEVSILETSFSFDDDEAILENIKRPGGRHARTTAFDFRDAHRLENYRSELRVNFTGQQADFVLTVTPPRREGLSIIDSGVIGRDTLVLVEWGYASSGGQDVLSGPYLFRTNKPTISVGDDVVITVQGTDLFHSVAIRNERPGDIRRYPRSKFPRDFDIIASLARENKLKVIDNLEFFDKETSPLFKRKGKDKGPDVVIPRQNDWLFFKRLLRENRAGFAIKGNEIILFDQEFSLDRPAQWNFRYFSQILDDKTIPLQSFTGQVQEDYYGIAASKSLECVQDDPDRGLSFAEVINPATNPAFSFLGRNVTVGTSLDGDSQKSTLGDHTYGPELPPTEGAKHISLPEGVLNPDGVGQDVVRRAIRKAGLKADFTVVGHPQILPWDLAQVEGMGVQYSGKYQIRKCTHIIGMNGFDVQGELFRSGPGNVPSSDTVVPAGRKIEDRKTEREVARPTEVEEPADLQEAERTSRRIVDSGGSA